MCLNNRIDLVIQVRGCGIAGLGHVPETFRNIWVQVRVAPFCFFFAMLFFCQPFTHPDFLFFGPPFSTGLSAWLVYWLAGWPADWPADWPYASDAVYMVFLWVFISEGRHH